jgi:hypothetical protein
LGAVSAALVLWMEHQRRTTRWADLSQRDAVFLRRRHRLRALTAYGIGAIGLAVVLGVWVEHPVAAVVYWLGIILLALGIVVAALIDALRTLSHYAPERRYYRKARNELVAELSRIVKRAGEEKGDESRFRAE